jgi:catechol 2,3-dioxygenase-like lactoylglutathione lyase family enzyme
VSKICHLLEAALYADDLDRAEAFYRDALGLHVIGRERGRHVFFQVGESVLLVFNADETLRGTSLPPHGAKGPAHVALGIGPEHMDGWRRRLEAQGVVIEAEVSWPRGGRSLYFRDPAGNSVELVTPGCWGLPSGW